MKHSIMGYVATFVAVAVFTLSGSFANRAVLADDPPADVLMANTVWQGTCEQSDGKASISYPVVLFIKQRKGDKFEATAWYPSIGDGLVKASGKVGPKGAVTFTEDKVIHGEATPDRPGVVAGSKYTATLDRNTLKGTGEWEDPKTKQKATLKFSLKLAE